MVFTSSDTNLGLLHRGWRWHRSTRLGWNYPISSFLTLNHYSFWIVEELAYQGLLWQIFIAIFSLLFSLQSHGLGDRPNELAFKVHHGALISRPSCLACRSLHALPDLLDVRDGWLSAWLAAVVRFHLYVLIVSVCWFNSRLMVLATAADESFHHRCLFVFLAATDGVLLIFASSKLGKYLASRVL